MFVKTGVPEGKVEQVYCSCGGEIDLETKKCKKCNKDYVDPSDTSK